MELQASRYAAMVSAMTFDRAVSIYTKFLTDSGLEGDAESLLREFMDLEDSDESVEDRFAQDIRIVLASAEFGKELTTSVIWLNDRGLDNPLRSAAAVRRRRPCAPRRPAGNSTTGGPTVSGAIAGKGPEGAGFPSARPQFGQIRRYRRRNKA